MGYEPSRVKHCTSIEEFAGVYWETLRKQFSDRNLILGGYSYGGLVAYEMARLANNKHLIFLLDPNLPLAMRSYVVKRLFELRFLASIILPKKIVLERQVFFAAEDEVMGLLEKYIKRERIEAILATRMHCLAALSRYPSTDFSERAICKIHAEESLGLNFIDENFRSMMRGYIVPGNHFTMLNPGNVDSVANIINSELEKVYEYN